MKRLTQKRADGRWVVSGVDFEGISAENYICLCKLKDYEDCGLSPDEVWRMKYTLEDLQKEIQKMKEERATLKERKDKLNNVRENDSGAFEPVLYSGGWEEGDTLTDTVTGLRCFFMVGEPGSKYVQVLMRGEIIALSPGRLIRTGDNKKLLKDGEKEC